MQNRHLEYLGIIKGDKIEYKFAYETGLIAFYALDNNVKGWNDKNG